jgi:hypothetical protein
MVGNITKSKSGDSHHSVCGIPIKKEYPKCNKSMKTVAIGARNNPSTPRLFNGNKNGSNGNNIAASHMNDVYSSSYFSCIITREESEILLRGFPTGTFLIRNSACEKELRISITAADNSVMHTPIKYSHHSDGNSTSHLSSMSSMRYIFRCGRKELRGIEFDSLSLLIDRLHLNPSQYLILS